MKMTFKKSLPVFLLILSFLFVFTAGIVSTALTADAPEFELSAEKCENNILILTVNLVSGGFNAIDAQFEYSDNVDCISLKQGNTWKSFKAENNESGYTVAFTNNAESGQISAATVNCFDVNGDFVVAEFEVDYSKEFSIAFKTTSCFIKDGDYESDVTSLIKEVSYNYIPEVIDPFENTVMDVNWSLSGNILSADVSVSSGGFNALDGTFIVSGGAECTDISKGADWNSFSENEDENGGTAAFIGKISTGKFSFVSLNVLSAGDILHAAFDVDDSKDYSVYFTVQSCNTIYNYESVSVTPEINNNSYSHIVNKNKCGNDLLYDFDENTGILTISGSGPMYNYYIDASPFGNNATIKEIKFDGEITSVGDCSFINCTGLQYVELPDSVEYVGDSAFNGCSSLREVNLGNNPDLIIGYNAFDGCNSVEKYIVGANCSEYATDGAGVLYNKEKTGLIKYPGGCTNEKYNIDDSVVYINENAFENSINLKDITLPATVMNIGDYAFSGCSSLNNVYYSGTEKEWNEIYIGIENEALTNADIHFASEPDENKLTIKAQPIKTVYHVGEIFDGNGMVIGLLHSDGTDEIVNEFETEYDFSVPGEKQVTVRYLDYSIHIPVTVCEHILTHVAVPPTCAGNGTGCEFDLCTYCGEKLNFVILQSSEHKLVHIKIDPTCTEDGQEYDCCTVCGEKFNVTVIKAKGHIISDHINIPRSCTEDGESYDLCSVCGEKLNYYFQKALGHQFTSFKLPATDTANGISFDYCTICGAQENVLIIPAHEWGEWKIVYYPTPKSSGLAEKYCKTCDEVKTFELENIFKSCEIDNNIIFGLSRGMTPIDFTEKFISDAEKAVKFSVSDNDKLGTGSTVTVSYGEDIDAEYTVLVFGDVNGDGLYDARDSVIVNCLLNGLLTKEQVGETVYNAADCDHDGIITENDVYLIEQAGLFVKNISQTSE